MTRNGTGLELVPVLDMGNWTGTSSTFEKKNGTERSSKNFGTGPITAKNDLKSLKSTPFSFYSFSGIGPMADLMSSSYLDKSHCYNSHAAAAASAAVYSQNYGSPHCYYGNMDYLSSSGNSHHSLSVSCERLQLSVVVL